MRARPPTSLRMRGRHVAALGRGGGARRAGRLSAPCASPGAARRVHRAAGQRGAAAGLALPPGVHLQGVRAPLCAEHLPPRVRPRRRYRHVPRLPQPPRDRRQPGLVLGPARHEEHRGDPGGQRGEGAARGRGRSAAAASRRRLCGGRERGPPQRGWQLMDAARETLFLTLFQRTALRINLGAHFLSDACLACVVFGLGCV